MTKPNLTIERLRELLHYCPETGIFTAIAKNRCGRKSAAGNVGWCDGKYWRLCIDGKKHWAHRIAFLYMTGDFPLGDVDHINGCGTNNKWVNLRDVPTATNVQNVKRASKNSSTGVLGIENTKSGKFQARIMTNGNRICLGTYATKEAAHAAYIQAKREMHDGCTI